MPSMSLTDAQEMYKKLGYEIKEEIGKGGFKQVFLARYDSDLVAFKVLLGSHDFRARREVKLMSEIDSNYVARIIDFNMGSLKVEAFVVEEYISAISLYDKVQHQSLTLLEFFKIIDDIFQALIECASRRIVHRDVKPSNILIRDNGAAVLTDFGLARPLDESTITMSGITIGTLAYAPPEFLSYKSALISETSDLFSLGIMCYEFLVHRHPFISPQTHSKEIALKEMHEASAVPPHQLVSSIDEKLSKFIMKLIRREPINRYPSTQRAYEIFQKHYKRLVG